MGFWARVRARLGGEPADLQVEAEPPVGSAPAGRAAVAAIAAARAGSPEDVAVAELARVGASDGPTVDVAMGILRRARGTLREAEAVSAVSRAAVDRSVPAPLRVACAEILATRGDDQQALRLLEGVTSSAGLLLAADLHASSGQVARAVGTIERVLARDIEAPGAKERHARWRASLGRAAPARRHDEATVVAPLGTRSPFRLLREVARGGAGVVYEAEDEVLGRRVAFKVYHGRGQDRALAEREARITAALAGPGVLRVLDAAPVDGWIALEWIARGSVRDVLRTGDVDALLPLGRWARPLARAIARLHREGFVHADVKPANVLLRGAVDPVLGDFGIAQQRGAPSDGGSPGYISPERLAGRESDPRDDVYGYGRIIEDVIHRLDEAVQAGRLAVDDLEEAEPWQTLALRCVGQDERRPPDGDALVAELPR